MKEHDPLWFCIWLVSVLVWSYERMRISIETEVLCTLYGVTEFYRTMFFFFLSLLSIKCRLFAFFVSWINFSLSLVSMLAVIKQNNSWRNVLRTNLTFQQRKWLNINQCWWTAAQINSVPFIKCGTTVVFYNNEHIVLFVTACFLDTNTKTLCINYHDECNILHAYFY